VLATPSKHPNVLTRCARHTTKAPKFSRLLHSPHHQNTKIVSLATLATPLKHPIFGLTKLATPPFSLPQNSFAETARHTTKALQMFKLAALATPRKHPKFSSSLRSPHHETLQNTTKHHETLKFSSSLRSPHHENTKFSFFNIRPSF
jgi:hypothetical protein